MSTTGQLSVASRYSTVVLKADVCQEYEMTVT